MTEAELRRSLDAAMKRADVVPVLSVLVEQLTEAEWLASEPAKWSINVGRK